MSDTLHEMLLTRLGYRTESYSGSGVRDLRAVLEYELSVLQNSDILVYCNHHYSAGFAILYSDDLSKVLAPSGDDYPLRVERIVRNRLHTTRPLYALWLTTKANVSKIYGGIDTEITGCVIPENSLVLSDLGPQGALFVYQKHPSLYTGGQQPTQHKQHHKQQSHKKQHHKKQHHKKQNHHQKNILGKLWSLWRRWF